MSVNKIIFNSAKKIIKEDKKIITTLLYFSLIEALLTLSIPLSSSFIVNSVMSHAEISLYILGFIMIILFLIVTLLQVTREYIIEKFQQKIFVTSAIDISTHAVNQDVRVAKKEHNLDKQMNYFFDITAIQKFFPLFWLDGMAIVVQIFVSLLLLFFFDPILFVGGVVFSTVYLVLLLLFGKNGYKAAIDNSDAKHSAIYYLQHIHDQSTSKEEKLSGFDHKLSRYVSTREARFKIIIRQKTLSFITEGIVFSGFLVIGGYLVIEGHLPVGEFIAAEIIVVSITYAIKGFVKKLDYIYDTIEGFYKVDKLSEAVGANV
jgi:ABC-type bacteriocin/lantibiotic exporter with double-glycine peptidase domain